VTLRECTVQHYPPLVSVSDLELLATENMLLDQCSFLLKKFKLASVLQIVLVVLIVDDVQFVSTFDFDFESRARMLLQHFPHNVSVHRYGHKLNLWFQ